ncbi:CAP domain-containing protein [Tundrisphaera sp. TA3]|uniref:CAP domain-containing protein n=1 Tax=Tundrisphaera sp. TA3 TaxID=3435775 RepID=UPI003EBF3365
MPADFPDMCPTPPRSRRLVLAALLAGAGLSCTAHRPAPLPSAPRVSLPDSPAPDDGDVVEALVAAHAAERARKRLPPLVLNPELEEAARGHAREMASRRKMSHTGADRSSPFDRMSRVGYRYTRAAENVAAGQRDVAEVMSSWMHSPGHRRNILGDYAEIGVARAVATDGTAYWCATFGTPSSARSPASASAVGYP